MTLLALPPGAEVEAAPAKLNLYLHVTGRRADGYHLLDSLIAFADVHDTVVAAPAGGLSLRIAGPFAAGLEAGDGNLVLHAARALADLAGIDEPGAALTLVKRLPVASGIGGGSADAAAALRALVRLWRVYPAADDLMVAALDLGADVPMCLAGIAATASGVGEQLAPMPDLPEARLLLVNPGVPVSTPAVFKARTGAFTAPDPIEAAGLTTAGLAKLLATRGNDLERPARMIEPMVGMVLDAIAATGGCLLARMSGSGATCFGLYAAAADAQRAGEEIAAAHPGWWTEPARLVGSLDAVAPSLDTSA